MQKKLQPKTPHRLETHVDGDDFFEPFIAIPPPSSRLPPGPGAGSTTPWTPQGSHLPEAVASNAAPRPPRGAEGGHRSRLHAGSAPPSTPTSTRRRGRGPGCRSWPSSPSSCSGASSSSRPRTSGTPTTPSATGSPLTARGIQRYGTVRHALSHSLCDCFASWIRNCRGCVQCTLISR